MNTGKARKLFALLIVFWLLWPPAAKAADVQGPANAGRVEKDRQQLILPPAMPEMQVPEMPDIDAPEGTEQITFVLNHVQFEGVTVFDHQQLEQLYKEYLGTEVTLSTAWKIANALTQQYRENGYFLSRAYVPLQEIEYGIVKIQAVEGYVDNVDYDDKTIERSRIIDDIINSLMAERPLKQQTVENNLLLLNDLPGLSFRAIFQESKNPQTPGAVNLLIVPAHEDGNGFLSFDNYGSRFLGPFEATASYQYDFIPQQETTITVIGAQPISELQYIGISQKAPIFKNFSIIAMASFTKAEPGYNLEFLDVESESTNLGIVLEYDAIRQRDENLTFKLSLDGKNTNTDIVDTALTRDRVRALRFSSTWDINDDWDGRNYANVTFSHGLDILSASQRGEFTNSRFQAAPDFRKIEYYVSRTQAITPDWGAVFASSGQYSPDTLFSSEEFGYGGQNFGRAYDSSEITGDKGVAASVELRFFGLSPYDILSFVPYTFYDIGKVWNNDTGSVGISGSSAGIGVRLQSELGLAGNLSVAKPLTKPASAPQSSDAKNPRYLLQFMYIF